MKRKRTAALLLTLLLFAGSAGAEERIITPSIEWEPPVIDESVLGTEPWLLAVKVAQEELGYVEGPRANETKYGAWMGNRRSAWCTEFVLWCADQADRRYGASLLRNLIPYRNSATRCAEWYIARGRFVTGMAVIPRTHEKQWLIGADHYMADNEYIPFPGDMMWLFYYSANKGADHTALVEGVSVDAEGRYWVHVIEGNNPDRVQRNAYAWDDKHIYGYGTPVRRAHTDTGLYDTFDDVYPLQAFLIQKGLLKGVPGRQIERTAVKALKAYQQSVGVKASGILDLETRSVMEKDPDFLSAQQAYPQK